MNGQNRTTTADMDALYAEMRARMDVRRTVVAETYRTVRHASDTPCSQHAGCVRRRFESQCDSDMAASGLYEWSGSMWRERLI